MQKALKFLVDKWVLLLVLIVFTACKFPQLFYAYYWDESWPYAPALKQMYHRGISLLPTALDTDMSRGHPLLFHALAAGWMNVFGVSHFSMHSFALTISLLFLIAIYQAGIKLYNKNVAIMGLLLVATQVIFFVQSSFVLLEVLVAFLAFISLVFYAREQYWQAAISLTALFYTKESGLVLGVVLMVDAFLGLFKTEISVKNRFNRLAPVGSPYMQIEVFFTKIFAENRIKRLASVVVPCMLIGGFFLLQHHIRGWYIFPLHANLVEHSWDIFWHKFWTERLQLMFYANFKFYTYLLLLITTVIATAKSRQYKLLAILIPAAIIYYFIDESRGGNMSPNIPIFILFILITIWFLTKYASKKFFDSAPARRFMVLSGLFVFGYICFSLSNFFTYRYLLAAIVPMLFLAAIWFDLMIRQSYKWLVYPIITGIMVIGFFSFKLDSRAGGDADLGAFSGVEIHREMVDFLEQANAYDSTISVVAFQEAQHLANPETGFLHTNRAFTKLMYEITPQSAYIIFDNIEPDPRYANIEGYKKDFYLLKRFENGKMWGEIYKHK